MPSIVTKKHRFISKMSAIYKQGVINYLFAEKVTKLINSKKYIKDRFEKISKHNYVAKTHRINK